MTNRIAPPAAAALIATARRRRGWVVALLLAVAACAAEPPPPPAEAPPPPPPVGWRAIPSLSTSGDIAGGYVQERGLVTIGAVRRAWILLNLRESIPIPETGGRAQSVRFVGEYRCAQREWRPLEGAWFARPNAQDPVHAERPRGGFRPAPAGTLGGSFLDAACGL
ncbi:surface-adhesin E family protein [Roseomonas sp. CAU 1739]|uniref:surface-adhesin E family protein n=1 Tax=Roseomonas sp. CAU 1739 TaxID=3140364 RepID=UPI00325ADA1D